MHHTITVTSSGSPPFDYEENGHHGPNHHVLRGDTVSWRSPSGEITVSFHHGSPTSDSHPPSAPKDHWTKPIPMDGVSCKYDVTIGGRTDDPQIIFDDGGFRIEDMSVIERTIGNVSRELFAQLREYTPTVRGDTPVFFPQGINLISLTVDAKVVSVTIKVGGPNVSG